MSRKRTQKQNEEAITRGEAARQAIENGVVRDAFQYIEQAAMARCRTSKSPGESYNATLVLQVSEQVWQMLKAFISEGKTAAADLERGFAEVRRARELELSHVNYLTAAQSARSDFDGIDTATREEETNG
jgi:hypothetical protein